MLMYIEKYWNVFIDFGLMILLKLSPEIHISATCWQNNVNIWIYRLYAVLFIMKLN